MYHSISGDSSVQFKTLPDFYLACHLHDAFHGPEYFPPAWAPEVEDWTETPGDMVLSGNCYSLDLSKERGPGEGFYLALAVEDRNQTEVSSLLRLFYIKKNGMLTVPLYPSGKSQRQDMRTYSRGAF